MKPEKHNPNALKHMYGAALLKRMGEALAAAYPRFDRESFSALADELTPLEMKPRVRLIRDELRRQLPSAFPAALKILLKSLKSKKLQGFDLWPYTEFIQAHGLDHVELSLEALKAITVLFTSEFAVRPFLIQDERKTLDFLTECAGDADHRVRRWASEGSRPRLPWGEKLHHFIKHPELTLPILDKLRFDPELFVRKSVANHLNDVAKDHPALVIQTLKGWLEEARDAEKVGVEWITRHSLRTLIKQGHRGALGLLGVKTKTKVKLGSFRMGSSEYRLNERLDFSFVIHSMESRASKLVVDYKIHFLKAGGKMSAKVFKLKTFELPGGGTFKVTKSHHLKEVTTRVHYPGLHALEIMINGVSYKKVQWRLTA